jgi:uncharacterized protein YdcH (DUF465 family)
MPVATPGIREHLMANSAEFQKLAEQHRRFASQLEELTQQAYLNGEDLILQIELKKRKLRLKDEMEQLVARHQRELASR